MMSVFFFGIGLASIATGFARTPLEIAIGLFVVGVFAAIYHPVGLAIVVERWKGTGMRIAVNGVWGNLGVGSAALITGYFIDHGGWRVAFFVPGVFAILIGIAYTVLMWPEISRPRPRAPRARATAAMPSDIKALLVRVSAIVFLTTAVSSVVFQSTTFALPKVFDERLGGIAVSATAIGGFAFAVYRRRLHGAADRRALPRPTRRAHRVRGCCRGSARLLRAHAGPLRLGRALVRHGLHAGGVRPDPHQRLHDRPPRRRRMAGAHLRACATS